MIKFRYSSQTIDKKDILNVGNVLKSDFLTQGPKTVQFENNIKKITRSKYVVSTNSGSSALLLACKSLSLKKGAE